MDQIYRLEKEIADLRRLLQEKENELRKIKNDWTLEQQTSLQTNYIEPQYHGEESKPKTQIGNKLPKWAIERYSRQILLPDIGVRGQEKLCSAKVLIVGAGGLGCPAAVYLAGAGVGEIGIVDYDTVDLTNIHRQFLHDEIDQFTSKAESAANKLRSLNSRIKVTPYNIQLDSSNSLQLVSQYDVVLDCTDNVPTRYLLNDSCVMAKLPLISGSALKMEGQLTVYGHRSNKGPNDKMESRGPCYRCVFPTPPPAEAVGSCSANGVAGPVPGAIGALQALEAIKFLVGQNQMHLLVERMLLFDGDDMTFRTVKLRPRSSTCAVCSDSPTITKLLDYEVFCSAQAKEKKKQETCLITEIRKREKEKRMTGQSYYGFRSTDGPTKKWIQDVPKSERKMGPACNSDICAKGKVKKCYNFDGKRREEIFSYFWNELDWKKKRNYVRSLIESVPVKRRRLQHKGEVSRKGDSKLYHLMYEEKRLPVCRVMFLNTLGIKEAMVRCWLHTAEKPKTQKKPQKSINVETYIDNLPKTQTKCQYCITNSIKHQYINIDNIKNSFQLYNMYVTDMKSECIEPVSRKTFSKAILMKNVRIFKPKNENDVCDLVSEHNTLPSLNDVNDMDLQILSPKHRISPKQLYETLRANCEQRHLLVDVRSEAEFQMCNIGGSTNYPIEKLSKDKLSELAEEIKGKGSQVTFVCRRGNDSQIAAQKLLNLLDPSFEDRVNDLNGGLHSWSKNIDNDFPIY